MIETSSLATLMAINKAKSFSKAAEELHVTQSAISQSVKNLEKKIGVKLISRSGKQVALTHEGLKLCYLGKDFFKKYDLVMGQILEEKQKVMGRLVIGTLTGVGKSFVASRAIEFATQYPDVDVQVIMDFPENLVRKFENNEIDILIVPETIVPASAERLELENEYSTLVFPVSDKFAIRDDISLKELTEYPIIFFEENDPLFLRWCRERYGSIPRNIRPKVVVNSFGHMLKAVHSGLGVAVIPLHVFKRSYFRDKVATLSAEHQVFNDRFYFVYHEEAFELLKVKTLYDFMRNETPLH
jgi:DNA-binding transcriptional LysR family regulator